MSEQGAFSIGANDRREKDGREVIGTTCIIRCRCCLQAPVLQDLRGLEVGNHVRWCLNCAVQEPGLDKTIIAVTVCLLEESWLSSAGSQQGGQA